MATGVETRSVATSRSLRPSGTPFPKRRLAAAAVLLLMAALYVSPVQKYLRSSERLNTSRAEIAALQRRHDQLLRDSQALQTTQQIVLLARECGWVYPGETSLVIQDIHPRVGAQCR